MSMLIDIKAALRISAATTAYDTEVNDLIAAARDDLRLAGVIDSKVEDDEDKLIKRAITTYCKSQFGYENPDADRLQKAYEMLKMHLTLSVEYTVEPEVTP